MKINAILRGTALAAAMTSAGLVHAKNEVDPGLPAYTKASGVAAKKKQAVAAKSAAKKK